MVVHIPLIWVLAGAGLIIGKFVLFAYNEERIKDILESTRNIINKFPEHRKKFWNERLDGLINMLPKKQFVNEVWKYSQEEIQHFSEKIQDFYNELVQEIGTLSKEVAKELLEELQKLFSPLQEHFEKVKNTLAWVASKVGTLLRFWKKDTD